MLTSKRTSPRLQQRVKNVASVPIYGRINPKPTGWVRNRSDGSTRILADAIRSIAAVVANAGGTRWANDVDDRLCIDATLCGASCRMSPQAALTGFVLVGGSRTLSGHCRGSAL